ncbi:MAG: RidA family protein [Flavisolibacter sp.]|jgi:enamine deaminase RidA (YjgF/YER057c/UK114 family)|nr:RidA family protein [Flavisolibacter sp.]
MSGRINYSSGAPWEAIVGYSRAVRAGNVIEVSGTVASDENGAVTGEADAYLQTKYILEKIKAVLEKAGAEMRHVVRTRIFVTDIRFFDAVAKAHVEVFKEILPCTSLYQVAALVSKAYLVEIEATAILEDLPLN